jgi:hypothetical protein
MNGSDGAELLVSGELDEQRNLVSGRYGPGPFEPPFNRRTGSLPLGPMNTGGWWPKWARPPSTPRLQSSAPGWV